jgi:TPR repeat protein
MGDCACWWYRRNNAEAVEWYRKAADQGHAEAQCNLGILLWNGDGVARDRLDAIKWFRKAAAQGSANAQFSLGVAYVTGDAVAKDHVAAARLFLHAAEQGHDMAQYNLSVLYGKGEGVEKDCVEAYKWATLAARQNAGGAHAQALELASGMTGEQLQEGLNRAKLFESKSNAIAAPDEASPWDLVREFAESGDIEAQQLLAHIAPDKGEALKWVRMSAEQGSALAQYRLGVALATGDGIPQDESEAAEWLRKAAEQKFTPALNESLKLARISAEKGDARCQFYLATACRSGVGVPQNYVEAYKWANLAAAQGLEPAAKFRDELAQELTASQLAEAQLRAEAQAERSLQAEIGNGNNGAVREPIPSAVRREVWRRDQGRCARCGSREKLEYDHIVPVARGGSNTARNIELLCERCNRSKSDSIQ